MNITDLKKATASQVVNHINLKWYDDEIDKTRIRISNILAGQNEYVGIYEYIDSNVLYGDAAKKRVEQLKRRIKDLENKKKTYTELVQMSYNIEYRLDSFAQKNALMSMFINEIDNVEYANYDLLKDEKETPEFFKENNKKIMRARRHDAKELSECRHKITNHAYSILKKYADKVTVKVDNTDMRLDHFIEETRYSLDTIFDSLYHEKSGYYQDNASTLKVNVPLLKSVENRMKKNDELSYQPSLVGNPYDKYFYLSRLKDKVSNPKLSSYAYSLFYEYEEILKRGKILRAIEDILLAFRETEITNDEVYKTVSDACQKEIDILRDMVDKANKKYDSKNFQVLIDNSYKLDELYRNYLMAMNKHSQSDEAMYSSSIYTREADKYRNEMYVILTKYPELNKPEYNINLSSYEDIRKKGVEQDDIDKTQAISVTGMAKSSLVDRIKNMFGKNNNSKKDNVTEEKVDKESLNEKIDETITIEDETELKEHGEKNEKNHLSEDERLRQPIEMPEHLTGLTVVYYQEYMRAKLVNPEYSTLKYSEYLELKHPELKEYINIEKEKETRAATIYGKYLQYRASLPNKEDALSFKQFALQMYNLESYDIPNEYLEESSKSL